MKKVPPEKTSKAVADEVGEVVAVYGARNPGISAGRVVPPGGLASAWQSLTPELRAMLDRMNQPQAREALRKAYDAAPTEFGQAAVALARKS